MAVVFCFQYTIVHHFWSSIWIAYNNYVSKNGSKNALYTHFRKKRYHIKCKKKTINCVKKYGQNWRNLKIWRKSGKNRKKSGNRMRFRKRRLLYLIWEVNHGICQEIWLKPLKSEDLRSVLEKSRNKN